MATECSKIAIFGYPSCIYPPPSDGGVPWYDLRKIFRECQQMAKVIPNGVEILSKIFNRLSRAQWRTNVTDSIGQIVTPLSPA